MKNRHARTFHHLSLIRDATLWSERSQKGRGMNTAETMFSIRCLRGYGSREILRLQSCGRQLEGFVFSASALQDRTQCSVCVCVYVFSFTGSVSYLNRSDELAGPGNLPLAVRTRSKVHAQ